MVTQGLSLDDIVAVDREIAFAASVIEMLRGDLGQPFGGGPELLQRKVLKGEAPITVRPGWLLPDADLIEVRAEGEYRCGHELNDRDLAPYVMYPRVFADFGAANRTYGPVSILLPRVFFYRMEPGEAVPVDLEPGKALVIFWHPSAKRTSRDRLRSILN